MKNSLRFLFVAGLLMQVVPLSRVLAQSSTATPAYKIVNSAQFPGAGGIDYETADSAGRRIYVPRGSEVLVFDLDTLKSVGTIANTRARGAARPSTPAGRWATSPRWRWTPRAACTSPTSTTATRT